MKKISAVFLCLVFLWSGVIFAQRKVVEQIIARVNDDIITQSDYERSKDELRQELSQNYFGADLDHQMALREKNILRDLIDQLLLIQIAKDDGISVDNDLVKQLDSIREKNHLKTMDDLEQAVTQSGISYEDFKNNIKNNLYTQSVIRQEVGRRVQVTQEEINKYYEAHKKDFERPAEVKFREILISTENKNPAQIQEAEKKAADLAARAKKGEDFAELAKKYSDGPTAKEGGEQDYIQRSQLLKEIADVAFKLNRNEVSEPIRTKFGFMIIKLEDKHEAGLLPVDRVSNSISDAIYMSKLNPALRQFLTEARKKAFVEVKAGWVDTGAAPGTDEVAAK